MNMHIKELFINIGLLSQVFNHFISEREKDRERGRGRH